MASDGKPKNHKCSINSRSIPIIGLICSAFVVASTTGDKWLVVCVLAVTASSDETTFVHVVTEVGPDEVPAVSQHCFFIRFQNNKMGCVFLTVIWSDFRMGRGDSMILTFHVAPLARR